MQDLVRVEPIALLPTQAGCAVFLGDGNKTIVFYIDPSVGTSINASLSGQLPPRPLTHDLYLLTLQNLIEMLKTKVHHLHKEKIGFQEFYILLKNF